MKFGIRPLDSSAEGAILVHSLRGSERVFRKGRVLQAEDITQLNNAGHKEATLARLEGDDIPEDIAAQRMADVVVQDESVTLGSAGTGRVNLYAAARGLFILLPEHVNAVNAINEAITLSTIRPFESVDPGQLLATVKIIPFAVSEATLALCEDTAASCNGLFRVAPYKKYIVGLLQTVLPKHREVLITKGKEATAARLAAMGLSLDLHRVCEHRELSIRTSLKELMEHGCDLALILGASAVADRRDVVPSAITSLGGEILQIGMPVDPGNLSFLGKINEMQLVGLPGSARSPRLHGSDWIIQRLVTGMAITVEDIRNMGVGGLLKEIPSRPMPRTEASPPRAEATEASPQVAAIVLAAGQSQRMGRQNKLLAEIEGMAMVAHTVDAILASTVESVTVVLGHEADRVRDSLPSRNVTFVENPDYAEGLSASLKRGLASLPPGTDAALICLGDMPRISAAEIEYLIASYAPNQGHVICVPTHNGKRGNPVLIGRRFFAEVQDIAGDVGARTLIGSYPDLVIEVEMENDAILLDIDTPEALAKFTG